MSYEGVKQLLRALQSVALHTPVFGTYGDIPGLTLNLDPVATYLLTYNVRCGFTGGDFITCRMALDGVFLPGTFGLGGSSSIATITIGQGVAVTTIAHKNTTAAVQVLTVQAINGTATLQNTFNNSDGESVVTATQLTGLN